MSFFSRSSILAWIFEAFSYSFPRIALAKSVFSFLILVVRILLFGLSEIEEFIRYLNVNQDTIIFGFYKVLKFELTVLPDTHCKSGFVLIRTKNDQKTDSNFCTTEIHILDENDKH